MKLARVVAGAIVLSATAGAAFADDGGWYIGLGAGQSQSKLNENQVLGEISAPGYTPGPLTWDNHGNAYKGFVGYGFSRFFAIEGSYFDLGKFDYSAPTTPGGAIGAETKVHGFAADLVGIIPFTPRFSAFAKIGASDASTHDAFAATAPDSLAAGSAQHWKTNPKFGGGLQYDLARHLALRAEWERYRIGDGLNDHGNVDAWFVSAVFPLGRAAPPVMAAPPPPPVVQPAPAPVAAPAPPPPPSPPPPAPRRVTFNVDELFSFNSAKVLPAGAKQLETFASELNGTTYNRIRVIGYTDRIGSDAYNLRLSQQRADAVKAHLVSVGGIAEGRIDAEGRGKADPVTSPGQCGAKRSAATIACLAPDRRVDVEVSGTQQP
jgi:OOP family OmpA-OmpF porin